MKAKWRRVVGIVSIVIVGVLVSTLVLSPEVPGARDVHQTILKLLNRLAGDHRAMDNQLDSMDGQLGVIDEKLNDKPSIRHLTVTNAFIDGFFSIGVNCSASFQVKAVYGLITGNETFTNVTYTEVTATGDFTGDGFSSVWRIRHTAFGPARGPESLAPYELLSQLQVELPVGVPGGGFFEVGGIVEGFAPITLSAGAVVETAQAALCSIGVLG